MDDLCVPRAMDIGVVPDCQAEARQQGSLRGVLLAILLCLVLLTLRLLRGDPLVAARLDALVAPRFERVTRTVDMASLTREDPSPGLVLPAGRLSPPMRAATRGMAGPRMLVWIGDCADCMAADLQLWEREARRIGVPLVLLTSGSPREVSKLRARKGLRSPVVRDAGCALSKRLNAAWAGRPYLFSQDWRLLWLDQRYPGVRNPFAEADVLQRIGDERRVQ